MKSTAKRLTLNTLAFLSARIIDSLAGILTVVLVARYLGVKDFGEYAFVTVLVGFLVSMTYFGLERVAIREIAQNHEAANESLGAVLVVRWALSVVVILAIAGYLSFTSHSARITLAMAVATISELIWASGSVFSCSFKAYEKMHLETATTFIFRLASLFFIGLTVYFDGGFLLLFVATCCANIIRTAMAIYYSKTLSIKPHVKVDFQLWKRYAKEAFVLGAVVVLAIGTMKTGLIALKYMKEIKEVAYFQSAQSIVLQMQVLPISLAMALFPMLSQLGVKSREKLAMVSGTALKYLFIASVPIAIVLSAFSEHIIRIIFGGDFAGASAVLRVMAWCVVPLFVSSLIEFVLISMNRQQDVAKSWAVAFVVNLALNVILIRSFGAYGAAIAVLISFVLLSLIQGLFLLARLELMDVRKTLIQLLLPLIFVIVFLSWFPGREIWSQVIGAALSIIVFFAFLFANALISLHEIKAFAKRDRTDS